MSDGKADGRVEELTLEEAVELLRTAQFQGGNVRRKILAIYDSRKPDFIHTLDMHEEA
jgi:hypothetical protein